MTERQARPGQGPAAGPYVAARSVGPPSLARMLALGAAALALLFYLLGFFGDVGIATGDVGAFLIGGGLLVGSSVLPQVGRVLLPGSVAVVVGMLVLLQIVASGGSSGILIIGLVVAFLEAVAAVTAFLLDIGLVTQPVPRAQPAAAPPAWTQAGPAWGPGGIPAAGGPPMPADAGAAAGSAPGAGFGPAAWGPPGVAGAGQAPAGRPPYSEPTPTPGAWWPAPGPPVPNDAPTAVYAPSAFGRPGASPPTPGAGAAAVGPPWADWNNPERQRPSDGPASPGGGGAVTPPWGRPSVDATASAPGQPMSARPVPGQPVPGQPSAGQPTSAEPVPGQFTTGPAVPGQAVSGQAVPGQFTTGQAVPGQAVPGQPVPGRPTTGHAESDRSTIEPPPSEQPTGRHDTRELSAPAQQQVEQAELPDSTRVISPGEPSD